MIDPYAPPKQLATMQNQAETCTLEQLKEIYVANVNYLNSLDVNDQSTESWRIQAQSWIDMLSDISKERFNINLSKTTKYKHTHKSLLHAHTDTVRYQEYRDAILIKSKATDTSRGIYKGDKVGLKAAKLLFDNRKLIE